MNIIWGLILTVFSSIAYIGQLATVFWPENAVKLGLTEPEEDVDPVFHADVLGEAYWDVATLWTLPLAGLLLILNSQYWAYFGLVGGGMYLYFAGRGIIVRRVLKSRGIRIGREGNLKTANIFLALWGSVAVISIFFAIWDLS